MPDINIEATTADLSITPTSVEVEVGNLHGFILEETFGDNLLDEESNLFVTESTPRSWKVTVVGGDLNLTSTNTTIVIDHVITALSGGLNLTKTDAVVAYEVRVTATSGNLNLQSTNALVVNDIYITVKDGYIYLTPTDVVVLQETNVVITATTGSLTITPTNAVIVDDGGWEIVASSAGLKIHGTSVTTASGALEGRDSRLYDNFITQYGIDACDPVNDVIRVIPVSEDYVFSSGHVYLSELGSYSLSPAVLLGARHLVGDTLKYQNRKIKFFTVTGSVNAFVLYKDTGNAATSELISYHNEDFNGSSKVIVEGDLEWILNTKGFFNVDPEDVYIGRVISFAHRVGRSNLG